MTERLTEDHIAMFSLTFLQLLLKVTATVLILAQMCDLTLQILQASAGKAVDSGS